VSRPSPGTRQFSTHRQLLARTRSRVIPSPEDPGNPPMGGTARYRSVRPSNLQTSIPAGSLPSRTRNRSYPQDGFYRASRSTSSRISWLVRETIRLGRVCPFACDQAALPG
jgi:hypothetical protein